MLNQLPIISLTAKITGNYTMKGVTKEVTADATLTYLDESEQTKMQEQLVIYLVCRQSLMLSFLIMA